VGAAAVTGGPVAGTVRALLRGVVVVDDLAAARAVVVGDPASLR
jgi:hypothetical protein